MPTVLITGGTGLIGRNLTRHLIAKGYRVIIVSRNSKTSDQPQVSFLKWNVEEQTIDSKAIINTDYIINLAGAGVMEKRWNEKYKKEIVESRTKSNELILKGLGENNNTVRAVISSSAIGWYGPDPKPATPGFAFSEPDPPSADFLGQTCLEWEKSIEPVTTMGKRLIKLRTGIVLSNDGGAFPEFIKPFRFGVAPVLGDGKQVISWIHMDDLCRIFIQSIEDESLSGSYNAVAPGPVNNKKLIIQSAKKIRGQFYIPIHIPQFLLKMVLGERSTEILKSTTVSCDKIKSTGYTFLYPTLEAALQQLITKR